MLRLDFARWYIYGVSAAAVVAFGLWIHSFGITANLPTVGVSCVLAVVCALSRRLPINPKLGKTSVEIEVADIAILSALVMGGVDSALTVAVPSMLYRERLRTLFQAATFVLEIVAAGYVFNLFSGPLLFGPGSDIRFVYGIMAAGLTLWSVDTVIGPTLVHIKYGTPVTELLKEVVVPPVPSEAVAILAALTTSYAAVQLGPVAAITLFSGAALSLGLMSFIRQRQKQSAEIRIENTALKERTESLEKSLLSSNLTFATRLVEKLGRRDGYTALHAQASAVYAEDVAKEFRLEGEKMEKLGVAALLQDVGMVSLPDEILLSSPEKLNSAGRMRLEEHPLHGEGVLGAIPEYEGAARWVRWHHERVDGTGYPDRLRGEWIPLEAKILAAASAYASLVLDRPYGPGLSAQEARSALIGMSEKALDGLVVRTLLRVLDREGEGYALAADRRFTFRSASGSSSQTKPAGRLRLVSGEAEAQ